MNPFDWPHQVRNALQAWAERIDPTPDFDHDEETDQ